MCIRDSFQNDNGASPILGGQSTRIQSGSESEDEEIIFNTQANKKQKMANEDALKVWFTKELEKTT